MMMFYLKINKINKEYLSKAPFYTSLAPFHPYIFEPLAGRVYYSSLCVALWVFLDLGKSELNKTLKQRDEDIKGEEANLRLRMNDGKLFYDMPSIFERDLKREKKTKKTKKHKSFNYG